MTRQEILKNAKPILFNTDMVRAILDGRKTVTRRVIKGKLQIEEDSGIARYFPYKGRMINGRRYDEIGYQGGVKHFIERASTYQPGDILYVRETWREYGDLNDAEQIIDGTEKYYYRADGENPTPYNYFLIHRNGYDERRDFPVWHPSIHMPKEAARIFLKVTNVRVERLQDMTIEDCEKEGVFCGHNGDIFLFMDLWNSTIKKSDLDLYGWNANHWVWVIEFERIEA